MKKLFLVDVSSMFFRAFYAIPPLSSPKGMPTNALYGLLSMTIKLLRENKPDYMVFCYDRIEPSFRQGLYPEYKANRKEMPEELVPQVPYLKKMPEILGIAALDRLGYEADDLIGTLATMGRANNLEVTIVSGDKDFAQLVSPFTVLYDTMKNVKYDSQGVVGKWGVAPEQMIDYLALVGDSSDNIPGVRGIGPKGAIHLLNEFRTLDGIYQNIDKISAKAQKARLIENKDMALLSQKLVTIVQDIDLDFKWDDFRLKPIDKDRLRDFLLEMGFKSFEKSLLGESNNNIQAGLPKAVAINKMRKNLPDRKSDKQSNTEGKNKSQKWIEKNWTIEELKSSIEPYSKIWGLKSDRGFLIGYKGRVGYADGEDREIGGALSGKFLKWKGFDLKEVFRSLQISDPLVVWDAMLAAYVLDPGSVDDFNQIYQRYCEKNVPDLASAGQIISCHSEIKFVLLEKLDEMGGKGIYEHLEIPLVPVLYNMEKQGIGIDVAELSEQGKLLAQDLSLLQIEIHKAAGQSFNIASPKQLGEILFEKMQIPAGKKTKSGYSTASDVIEKLAVEFPICGLVLKYRELAKLKSTYVDALPQLISKETGRLHTHYRQAATSTGRLSSVNPNLQNIPIRTERGRMVRKAFVADKGKFFISADYSQIELRILAHVTGDEGLVRAFKEDLDIHSATASEIFNLPLKDVTSEFRRKAKAVNFGIAYGQGVFGLAQTLGISRGESAEIIKKYFERFRKVKEYMTETVEKAKNNGFVETIFGRRRYIQELKSSRPAIRAFGERAAINAPIQGAASDLVKMAMIQLHEEIESPMILQVHDELLFECEEKVVESQSSEIKKIMEKVAKLDIPLKVNLAWGRNWEEAHS